MIDERPSSSPGDKMQALRPGIERRVFIVGVPRSGTTLLQGMLAAHSEVTSFTESHFFSVTFYGPPRARYAIVRRDPRARVREFLVENDVDVAAVRDRLGQAVSLLGLDPSRRRWWDPVVMRLRPGVLAGQLLALLDGISLMNGRRVWVEKTPHNLRFIPLIERISDPVAPTHFVHVLRDGLDVVASLCLASRQWPKPYTVESAVARWNDEIALSLHRIDRPRDHFVLYEDLAAEPGPTVRRLLAGLGLAWEPAILTDYGAMAERLTVPRETWKRDVDRAIRPSSSTDSVLSADQKLWARRALRFDVFERLKSEVVRRT